MRRIRLRVREHPLPGGQPVAFGIGLAIALFVGTLLLLGAGHDPLKIYSRMFDASLGGPDAWSITLNRAIPLGLAGLAVAVAGSMGLWNIGAEGQIIAGAIAASWVARIGGSWPGLILILMMLVAAVGGGALLALGPAMARAKLGVNEPSWHDKNRHPVETRNIFSLNCFCQTDGRSMVSRVLPERPTGP